MNRSLRLLLCMAGVLSALGLPLRAASQYFAEGWWLNSLVLQDDTNRVVADSVAIWSGGNFGSSAEPGTNAPSASFNDGQRDVTVRLEQSAFGQMVAGPLGYQTAVADLNASGLDLLQQGSGYATFSTLAGDLQRKTNLWDIRFPGTVNERDGSLLGSSGQNYFENLNRDAERAYRAALRIDPFNIVAAQGLLACYHHRMIPLTFAGYTASVQAGRARLAGGGPDSGEIPLLETNSLIFFERSAAEVIHLANSIPESGLLDGTYPYLAWINSPELTILRNKLMVSYARALALQGETLLKVVRLKYLSVYRDPAAGNYDVSGLLAFLTGRLAILEDQLLLANAFTGIPVLQVPELAKVRYLITELGRLRDSIVNGRLAFVGSGVDNDSAVSSFTYHEYPADYVPFFHDASLPDAQRPSSFDNLLARAKELATWSDTIDERAKDVVRHFDVDKFTHDRALSAVRDRYYLELGNLCGWIRTDRNELVPDVVLALLPSSERDAQYGYTGEGEAKGALYAQWRRILLAETELTAANQDIQNVVSNMRKKQEIANKIANGQENIAHLILANGEKIAALDREEGEAKAAAARTVARLDAQHVARAGIFSAVGDIVKGAASGGWAGAGLAALSNTPTYLATADKVQTVFQIGDVEAGLAHRLSEIQAQKTRIAATQGAAIQFQQRDETLLRTEEAMHGLVLEGERLRLNLLMAEQKLDMENLALASMVARVHFLVQEYGSALNLEQSNPLASPDYRLTRDLTLRDAEETFIHAQEWAYLAAKAAYYRVNGTAYATTTLDLLNKLLAERTGQGLKIKLESLQSKFADFVRELGGTQAEFATISLRHDVIQNNVVQYFADGDINPAASSLELTPGGLGSDADWLRFLQSAIVTNSPGSRSLSFHFATSLLRRDRNGLNANPLYHPTLYNALLFYSQSITDAHGVRINLRGRSLTNILSDRPVRVHLRQAGASYIRNLPARVDPGGAGIRVWNLNRVRRWKPSDAAGLVEQSEIDHLPETSIIFASLNGFASERRGGERLHELSPANDRWVFTIYEDITDNQPLFQQLDKLVDIEIRLSMRGF